MKKEPFTFSDFHVEFLGCLIPGLMTVVLSMMVIVWSMKCVCVSFCNVVLHEEGSPYSVLPKMSEQMSNMNNTGLGVYGNIGLLVIVSYVIGTIMFRKDPKLPDFRSARRMWRKLSDFEKRRYAVQPLIIDSSKENSDGANKREEARLHSHLRKEDVLFPYHFLHEYLEMRGMGYLCKWVPWVGSDPATHHLRTKMCINNLKVRLRFLVDEKDKGITKNEAHVMMSTSIWYSSSLMMGISFAALFLVIVSAAVDFSLIKGADLYGTIGFDFIVGCLSLYMKNSIEKPIHYMRVREVVRVLEVADLAERKGYKIRYEPFEAGGCLNKTPPNQTE